MARHNREARGSDQRDFEYEISYQPDWLRQVKVTRLLPTGRQSTMTLFTNPEPPAREPGREVRTEIRSEAQGLAFRVAVQDPDGVVRRIIVETGPPDSVAGEMGPDDVLFTIDHRV
jgi:hypothetical protein